MIEKQIQLSVSMLFYVVIDNEMIISLVHRYNMVILWSRKLCFQGQLIQ